MKTPQQWTEEVSDSNWGYLNEEFVSKIQEDARAGMLTPPGELRLDQKEVDQLSYLANEANDDQSVCLPKPEFLNLLHDLDTLRKIAHDASLEEDNHGYLHSEISRLRERKWELEETLKDIRVRSHNNLLQGRNGSEEIILLIDEVLGKPEETQP